jgi:prevent-host-death family protein
MLTISVNEARERLLELIQKATDGEGFVIADVGGQPLVKVLPYDESKKPKIKKAIRLDSMRGQCVIPDDIKAFGREEIMAMFKGSE